MFRPLRRANRAISEEDAKQLLSAEKRGVLAVNGDDGYPFAIPLNYFYDEENGKIYFHGARSGHKIDSLKRATRSASPSTAESISPRANGRLMYGALLFSADVALSPMPK